MRDSSATRVALSLRSAVARHLGFGSAGLDPALRQHQLVGAGPCRLLAVVDPGLHAALGLARRRRIGLGADATGQALAIGREIAALRHDQVTRFAGVDLGRGVGSGHGQHGTGLQPVHVFAREGLRVAAVQGHQHLVERHPRPLRARRDAGQGVAALHADIACRSGGCGARHRSWCGCWRRCPGHCRRRRRSRRGCRCSRRRRGWRSGGNRRAGRRRRCRHARGRIEQQRVLAHQPPGGPVGLDDHIDERLEQRPVADHPDKRTTVAAALQRDLGVGQRRVVFDAGGAVGLGRGDTQRQAGGFIGRDAGHVDLSTQGFAQRRLHAQSSQAQRPGRGSPEAGRGHGHGGQRVAPCVHRALFQGVPPKRSAGARSEARRR